MIKKTNQHHWVEIFWYVSSDQHKEAKLYVPHSCWQLNLVLWKSLSGGNGFKGMKESWSTAEAWHYERPEKLLVMVAASVVEVLGLKGSWEEAEVLAPCGKSQSLKRGQERIWLKVQQRSQHFGDTSTRGWSPKTVVGWSYPESRIQAVCCKGQSPTFL